MKSKLKHKAYLFFQSKIFLISWYLTKNQYKITIITEFSKAIIFNQLLLAYIYINFNFANHWWQTGSCRLIFTTEPKHVDTLKQPWATTKDKHELHWRNGPLRNIFPGLCVLVNLAIFSRTPIKVGLQYIIANVFYLQ